MEGGCHAVQVVKPDLNIDRALVWINPKTSANVKATLLYYIYIVLSG